MITFAQFRKMVASKLNPQHVHVTRFKSMLEDTDYEGPEIFGGTATPPHSAYECYSEYEEDGIEFNEWWEDEGKQFTRDWLIDMHPGLCPDEVVEAVEESLGV